MQLLQNLFLNIIYNIPASALLINHGCIFHLKLFGIYSLGGFNKIGLGNISELVELSGQNDKCSYFSLCTGKCSDNRIDLDRVPSVFSHKKAITLSKLQVAAKKNHHRSASKKARYYPTTSP